jgi:plasmid stabilization system protein ParE
MKKVIWNELALLDYHDNIDYLLKRWTEKEAIKFIDEVESLIFKLKKGKVDFKESGYQNIKECVVRNQITLYYQHVDKNTIELLRFWNTSQDNKKLKF